MRAGKVRYLGSSTFPASQIVEAQWVARERAARSASCASSRRTAILVRGIENDVLPTTLQPRHGRDPVEPARRRLAVRASTARGRASHRGGWSTCASASTPTLPHNARKLEAADALGALADEAGIPLVELALAWVINHPGITAAIVGARTVEHLEGQFPAASRTLDSALLDRIDEIVPPGTNFRSGDDGYDNPALEPRARRR